MTTTPRLTRSMLAVPATSPHFFEKAAKGNADIIFIDLEDSVAPARKSAARDMVIEALNDVDWQDKNMSVRINEIDSEWAYKEIIEIVEQCPRLDSLLIPKVSRGEDIRFVARLLDGIEKNHDRDKKIILDALIETPIGLTNVDDIAASSARLASLSFGVGDYSVAMQAPQTNFGSPDSSYGVLTAGGDYHWNDQWHYALARMANACRANGLESIDGPFTDFKDVDGYRACAERARALGFSGKWAIHPTQVASANDIFAPSEAEVTLAERINVAMKGAMEKGNGAVQMDGKMIDLAHVKQATTLLSKQEAIHKKNSGIGEG